MKKNVLIVITIIFLRHVTCENNFRRRHRRPLLGENVHRQKRRHGGQHGISRIRLLKKRRTVEHLQYVLIPLYIKVIQRCIIRAGIPRTEMLKLVLLQRLGEIRGSSRARAIPFVYTNVVKDLITGEILLPPAYIPPLPDVALLFGLVFVHALLWLLQRWSITVKQFVSYKHVNQPYEADAVLVIPFLHAGVREICALHLEPSLDDADLGYSYDEFKQTEDETIANITNHTNVELSNDGKKFSIFKFDDNMYGNESDLGWEMDENINSLQLETYNKPPLQLKGNSTGDLFHSQTRREVEMGESFPKLGSANIENDVFVESEESDDLLLCQKMKDKGVCNETCYPVQNGVVEDDDYDSNNNTLENKDGEGDETIASDLDFVESNGHGGCVGLDKRMRYFEYQNRHFLLSEPYHTFIIGNPQFNMIELPTQMKITRYLEQSCHGLCSRDIQLARLKYGPNELFLPPSTFRKVLMDVLFTPFKFFELFTYVLQIIDAGVQQTVQSVIIMLLSSISEARAVHSALLRTNKRPKYGVNSRRCMRVLRKGTWEDVTEECLVPGDVVSLVSGNASTEKDCRWRIPADMLLLCGHAVCDESVLSGESMPVPKIGICETISEIGMGEACNTNLDMKGVHHSNMLLSSATLLCGRAADCTITGRLKSSRSINLDTSTADVEGGISTESFFMEDEIKAYVVRTGFYSTEGKLMRMAERSKEPVRADFVEMGKVMLLLLGFAIFTMVYTVQRGRILVDLVHSSATTRFNNYRLILQCMRILSVIVPPHIPYTISRRCTQALLRISAHGLLCTEPWRIPWAGCVSQVLLDKTGTLTSADLAPSEMWTWNGSMSRFTGNGTILERNDEPVYEPVSGRPHLAPFEMCAIISSCHSVAECRRNPKQQSSSNQNYDTDEKLMIGDPIEVSGLRAVNWVFNPTTDTATDQAVLLDGTCENNSSVVERGEVEVLKRYAFCSKCQRMSVLGTVKRSKIPPRSGEKGILNNFEDDGIWCLTKGSPESILSLLEPSSIPPWYENIYKELGREGKRIIALAYNRNIMKQLGLSVVKGGDALVRKHIVAPIPREDCEADGSMQFGGFASFESPLRTDSPNVVEELQTKGGCNVTMVTGDGPHTAVAVATAAGILPRDKRPTLLLAVEEKGVDKKNNPCTKVDEIDGSHGGKNRHKSAQQSLVWKDMQELPKEELHSEGTAKGGKKYDDASTAFIPSRMAELSLKHNLCVTGPSLRAALSSPQRNKFRKNVHCIRVFSRISPELKEEVTTLIASTGRIVLYCGDGGNDVGALKSAHLGVALLSGFGMTNTRSGNGSHEKKTSSMEEDLDVASTSRPHPSNIQPMRCTYEDRKEVRRDDETPTFLKSLWVALRRNAVRAMHKRKERKSIEAHAGAALHEPEDNSGQASLVAPFTSRKPSISACVDLIKYGKHTAALILTIYQVVVLESILAGYTLSQLYLEGVRMSFTQKVLMALASMMSIYFIEEAPKDVVDSCLNEHRVPESIFHPSILSSTLAQAVCHIGSCAFAIHSAKCATPLDVLKKAQIRNLGRRKFVPSLVANVIVLMSLCQRASITICSYKGWPFTRPLFNMPWMILYACIVTITSLLLLFNALPWLNSFLNIYPWPRGSWSLQV